MTAVKREIRFVVDPVEAVVTPLPTRPAERAMAEKCGRDMTACWQSDRALVDSDSGGIKHGLVDAVHRAFSEHRPLVLNPDVIWLTIAQGLAQHINLNSERLRGDLVRHRGKEMVKLRVTESPGSASEWGSLVEGFGGLLAERHPDLADLIVCDFSTTGPAERIASQVVFMDALQRYYDYIAVCICGIPEIALEGTVDDWAEIARRVREISRFGAEFWTRHLENVCDQFVRAASGDVDREHWRAIYKRRVGYGTTFVNGWISHLFPYLDSDRRNPALDAPPGSYLRVQTRDEPVSFWGIDPSEPLSATWVTTGDFPNSLRSAPVHLLGVAGTGEIFDVVAGVVGFEQAEGSLRPVIGWGATRPTGVAALLMELDPMLEGRISTELIHRNSNHHEYPADMREFWSSHDGVTLQNNLGRTLPLLSRRELRRLELSADDPGERWAGCDATVFARAGEESLAVMQRTSDWPIVAWSKGDDHVRVVARSFTHFLEQVRSCDDPLFFTQSDFEPLEVLRYAQIEEQVFDSAVDPVTGKMYEPHERWDGNAEAWRIEERFEERWIFAIQCGRSITLSQAGVLRGIDANLATTARVDARDQLEAIERLVVVFSKADGKNVADRLDAAGLSYAIEVEHEPLEVAVHRETGKVLDLDWDEDGATLKQMRSFGVAVVASDRFGR